MSMDDSVASANGADFGDSGSAITVGDTERAGLTLHFIKNTEKNRDGNTQRRSLRGEFFVSRFSFFVFRFFDFSMKDFFD
jgi:hypothetical protein